MQGAGDHLHQIIRELTGEDFSPDCECRKWIRRMNRRGPAWVRRPRVTAVIVRVLREEAGNRGWLKILTRIPGAGGPIAWMIHEACRRAEADTRSEQDAHQAGD